MWGGAALTGVGLRTPLCLWEHISPLPAVSFTVTESSPLSPLSFEDCKVCIKRKEKDLLGSNMVVYMQSLCLRD